MPRTLIARRSHGASRQSTFALALGGGGARGLAHIVMLEAFDELGIRPKVIAGTSIGALFGAAYAAGLSAAEIRAHTELVLSQRFDLLRQLFAARSEPLTRFWTLFRASAALLDADALLDAVLPGRIAKDFGGLITPLKIVATDYYAQEPVVFTTGPLRQAVAASIALPLIFQPVMVSGRAMIDGGLVNPLPFDLLEGEADVVVAIDVAGAPIPHAKRSYPSPTEALFASAFIFERTIIREKLRSRQPDIYVDAQVYNYQITDFLKVKAILAAAEPAKAQLKRQLERVLASETVVSTMPVEPRPRRLFRRRSKVDG